MTPQCSGSRQGVTMVPIILLIFTPMVLSNRTTCYLQHYGYIPEGGVSENFNSAVKLFQETFGLAVDGQLNEETLSFMNRSRCGNKDELLPFSASPNSKWVNNTITWYMYGGSQFDDLIGRGFSLWAKHANLTFRREPKNPTITLSFSARTHMYYAQQTQCFWDFDGPGSSLAHAYVPKLNWNQTDIHFDNEEHWDFTMNLPPSGKVSFYLTLVHEIGHALGLSHSYVRHTVMWPVLEAPRGIADLYEYDLNRDDINAIQFLYGRPENTITSTTTTTTTTTTLKPTTTTLASIPDEPITTLDICAVVREINTFLVIKDKVLAFYRRFVWILSVDKAHRTREEYTKPWIITTWLPFLPSTFTNITAIYQKPNGEIAIFSEKYIYYVQYPELNLVRRQSYYSFFGKRVDKVNTALSTNTGKTFIFTEDFFVHEVDECKNSVKHAGSVSGVFPGVPGKLKGGFRYINGCLYFLIDNMVLEYNEFKGGVTRSESNAFDILDIACVRETLFNQLYSILRYIEL